jgi:hypothetical protein
MELENIILSEEGQKLHIFSHMWNLGLIQPQQYCEKQVTLRGGSHTRHTREGNKGEYG